MAYISEVVRGQKPGDVVHVKTADNRISRLRFSTEGHWHLCSSILRVTLVNPDGLIAIDEPLCFSDGTTTPIVIGISLGSSFDE